MNTTMINYKGQDYTRDVEMLGDVQKVTWYKGDETLEIFDQQLCLALEASYEAVIIEAIIPALPLI